jgi:hypothetical protein
MGSLKFKIEPMNKSYSPIILVCLVLFSIFAAAQTPSSPSDNLESRFLNPPTSVKPYVWWHWMGSNFSKEGISKDLGAMKAEGIGGATIFNLASAVQESYHPSLQGEGQGDEFKKTNILKSL